jgi:outer membrane lipoprotein-sorting protein
MNELIHKTLRVMTILFLSASFLGWGDTWNEIKNTSKKINTVEALFEQQKHMEILARPLVSKGKFYFQTPASLRWEYVSPVQSVLLMHAGKVKRYVRKGDAIVQDATEGMQSMQVVMQEIALWMKGDFDKNPGFIPELKQGRIVILTPREKSLAEIIQRIELKLSKTPGLMQSITIYESKKSYTIIRFHKVKLNSALPDSLFLEL